MAKPKKSKVGLERKRSGKRNRRYDDLCALAETIGTQWKRSSEGQRGQLLLIIAMACNALVAATD
jgi:hypothetical protein